VPKELDESTPQARYTRRLVLRWLCSDREISPAELANHMGISKQRLSQALSLKQDPLTLSEEMADRIDRAIDEISRARDASRGAPEPGFVDGVDVRELMGAPA
jgi:hypothetical protein